MSFENMVGKGENAGYQHFLLFPQCFLFQTKKKNIILATFNLLSANGLNLVWSKILSSGKELKTLSVTMSSWTYFRDSVDQDPIVRIGEYASYS